MKIPLYQVDAFTSQLFGGNPAAVCPLEAWPDDALLQAIALLKGLLADFEGGVGPKYEAAARYNLGVAYQRHGDEAKAIVEFNKVIDVMPGSLYSLGAQKALERGKRRQGVPGSTDE